MFIFTSIALTQVAPQLFPNNQQDEQQKFLQQISSLAAFCDREGIFFFVPTSNCVPS